MFLQFLIRFYELYSNIKNSSLSYLIKEDIDKSLSKSFADLETFTELNLITLTDAFYCKIGYAFLDYKGNFRMS